MSKLLWRAALLVFAGVAIFLAVSRVKDLLPPRKMPPATQALMDKLGQADRDLLQILFLIRNKNTGTQATAVLRKEGVLLTDASALDGARLGDLEMRSSRGEAVPIKGMEVNRAVGIAVLYPSGHFKNGVDFSQSGEAGPGDTLYTWGFPDDCDPPQPLLCMGFVAGFKASSGIGGAGPSRLILGGPFSEGCGGGPVYRWRDNQLVGLLVLRQAPPSRAFEEDLKRLANGGPSGSAEANAERDQLEGKLIREASRGQRVRAEVVPAATLGPLAEQAAP